MLVIEKDGPTDVDSVEGLTEVEGGIVEVFEEDAFGANESSNSAKAPSSKSSFEAGVSEGFVVSPSNEGLKSKSSSKLSKPEVDVEVSFVSFAEGC